jgi:nucleoside-diphosphate-sugar epimerase
MIWQVFEDRIQLLVDKIRKNKFMSKYGINKVALTGATGTLGTAIIRDCIANGIKVIAFTNRGSVNEHRIPQSDLVTKVYCSLEEMHSLETGELRADVFFHLAWGHTNRAVRNILTPQVDNIKYSLDSVDLAHRLGCRVYVGAGSQAEYGRTNQVLIENTPVNPETAYGMAKLCSGQMTRLACKNKGIKHIWPRILSTYGPNTQDTTILNYTISSLLHGQKPLLTACEQIWDFLYVDDAARALMLLATKGRDGEIYCVSSGETRTLKEYVSVVSEAIGGDIEVGFGEVPYGENTVMHLEGDITKLRTETGFEPMVKFEDGILKTIEWAKDYYR